jgi:hypothetical protein
MGLTMMARLAVPEDHGVIETLFHELSPDFRDLRGGEAFLDFSALIALVERKTFRTEEQVLLGFEGEILRAVASLTFLKNVARHHGNLEILINTSADSSVSMIRTMVKKAEELATLVNCDSLDVCALPGDQKTKSALEESGYKARLLVMNRTLKD